MKTAYGRLRGLQNAGLATFKGIPYAGSVSGANRFKAAPPLKPWTGVRDALALGAPSLQPGQRRNEPPQDEDCLFLNVWTPAADGRKRPVMFYSHGGGFTTGSAGSGYQDGGNLARTWDVVVVATNHRLGLMGYLYLGDLGGEEYATSGNQGLLDICDGLKWVHENIEAFGGDPANVMIFGESGGGAKTSCLYAMPSAAPYLQQGLDRERPRHSHDAAGCGGRNHAHDPEATRDREERLAQTARGASGQAAGRADGAGQQRAAADRWA